MYKTAVADCGCYDNRVDKLWWNEMWCGYPVLPEEGGYNASSAIVHAQKLKDDQRLLLVVGSNDSNVDPACTYQLAAALQREGTAFELHVMVGHGHGCAESAYGQRKRLGFVLDHHK